jgi:FeS assembly SUF system protein
MHSPIIDTKMSADKSYIDIKNEAIAVVQSVFDPEIPVNIYDLGLIYDINVDPGKNVHVLMTLTSPSCPAAESLPGEVESKIKAIEGVESVTIELTFDPPWSDELMSEVAKLELGLL